MSRKPPEVTENARGVTVDLRGHNNVRAREFVNCTVNEVSIADCHLNGSVRFLGCTILGGATVTGNVCIGEGNKPVPSTVEVSDCTIHTAQVPYASPGGRGARFGVSFQGCEIGAKWKPQEVEAVAPPAEATVTAIRGTRRKLAEVPNG